MTDAAPDLLRRNTRPPGPPAPFSAIPADLWLERESGDPPLTPAELDTFRLAWDWLGLILPGTFPHGRPRLTPQLTGLELLHRTLPYPRGAGPGQAATYACLPDLEMELIANASTQHRFEVLGGKTDRIRVYDARVAYLAACNATPVLHRPDDLTHDDGDRFAPDRRGFYRLDVTIPADWKGPGLIHAGRYLGHTHYPNRPGATFGAWCETGDVVRLDQAAWTFAIRERLLGAPARRAAGGEGGAQPLATWATKLRGRIELAESRVAPAPIVRQAAAQGIALPAVADGYRGLLRTIATRTIGALHQRHGWQTATYPTLDDAPPAPPGTVTGVAADGRVRVTTPVPFPRGRALFRHPEWSTAIWATSRARVLHVVRRLPPGVVLAIDGDALYVDAAHDPGLPDDGKVGRFRLKADVRLPRVMTFVPGGSITALRELVSRAQARPEATA